MPGSLVRVDDGTGKGNLVNLTAGDAARYIKAHPGAFYATPREAVDRIAALPEPRQDRPADEELLNRIADLEARLAGFSGGAGPTPTQEAPAPAAPAEPENEDVDSMLLPELKAYAAAHGIDLEGDTLKADILARVKAAQAPAAATEPATAGDGAGAAQTTADNDELANGAAQPAGDASTATPGNE